MSIFKKRQQHFFTAQEQQAIVRAVSEAEKRTSGEIRVYVESHCSFVNALDRAAEVFHKLKMEATSQRNAVLFYVAMKDRQLAIYADEGIYQREGKTFWDAAVKTILGHFNKQNYADGIAGIVLEIGESLASHFPFDATAKKNELPDDIVFGK